MVTLFTLTLFLSAALLFAVQPMFAKMALPILGGAPAVWNTCMVFFQFALFAGYLYAHGTVGRLGARRQSVLHLALMLAALVVLPVTVSAAWVPPAIENPSLWLLGRMAVSVGPPFFVLAASAPLLQRWLASTGHPDGRDPYFLYSASNLGSMVALLAYPLLIEPRLRLRTQSLVWSFGYGVLILFVSGCAAVLWKSRVATVTISKDDPPIVRASVRRKLTWLALAAVPSSLMLSVTTYISTDIAAIPLMWIIPLLLYLATFVLAFARRQWIPKGVAGRLLPWVVFFPVLLLVMDLTKPAWAIVPAHLLTFFLAALVCHQQLASLRPQAEELTDFYLWMSAGGMIGGIFNALVAPVVFKSPAEYPIGLLLACLCRPALGGSQNRITRFEVLTAIGLGLFAIPLSELTHALGPHLEVWVADAIIFGIPLLCAAALAGKPLRFAIALGMLLLSSRFLASIEHRVVFEHRNFFGISRVIDDTGGNYRYLVNGGTLHGMQALVPERAGEPLAYYNHNGPVGQVFEAFPGALQRDRVAAIGLGAGTVACYARDGQEWTFYEINPAVIEIARDSGAFTFLRTCLPSARFVTGDARLTFAKGPGNFDLVILDAFSSDAIPVHLITKEAFALYQSKLSPRGMLLFHITNRHLDLAPVLGDLARDAHLTALVQSYEPSTDDRNRGALPSIWVVMAPDPSVLGSLLTHPRWIPLRGKNRAPWSDDFSNLVSAFKWLQ